MATAGLVFARGAWMVASAAFDGFFAAPVLILILAIPPLLSAPVGCAEIMASSRNKKKDKEEYQNGN